MSFEGNIQRAMCELGMIKGVLWVVCLSRPEWVQYTPISENILTNPRVAAIIGYLPVHVGDDVLSWA